MVCTSVKVIFGHANIFGLVNTLASDDNQQISSSLYVIRNVCNYYCLVAIYSAFSKPGVLKCGLQICEFVSLFVCPILEKHR